VLVDDSADRPDLATLRDWALERLREPLTVADLARQVRMSPRTFARWFAAHTGTTPTSG
jgi:transcriptional regulator GlxA family with amidase domain